MGADSKVNILMVDDTPKKLLALEAVLGCLRQNIIKARSGREALRLLLQKDFAVILLDVHMPDMDGFETAELIRQRKNSEHTPIIFVTSINTDDSHIYKGYSIGAVDYIFTPVVPEVLQAKVSVFIDLYRKSHEIRRSQRQLADAQQIAHLGSWDWEIASDGMNWSEELYRILDLKPHDFEGTFEAFLQRVRPPERDATRLVVLNACRKDKVFQHECRIFRPDGSARVIELRGEVLRDDDGRPVRVTGTALDATQRKQAEEALRHSEEKFRSVTETAMDAIVTADATGRITYFNRSAERVFGYSAAEVLHQPVSLLFPELFRRNGHGDEMPEKTLARLRGHVGKTLELWARRRNGTEFPIELSLAEWKSDEQKFLTAIIRDVTARKEAERQLHENARELERAQKSLVGIMKTLESEIEERKTAEKQILEISGREQRRMGEDLHDGLGQSLTGIAFMSKTLSNRLASKGAAEAKDAGKIAELVNEAIRKTRELARGFYPVELESNGLLSALHELTCREEELFNVACSFEGPEDLEFKDKNRATQVYRIAQEAIENAIKHGRAKHVSVNLAKVQKELILTVQDDGCGIPKSGMRKIGMGLQLMKYRAGMIKGSFEIRRQSGGGTIMRCVFPESNGEAK